MAARHGAVLAALLLLSCAQFRGLTPADRVGPNEKLHYLVLYCLDEAAGRNYLAEPSEQGRADYLDWFWQNSGYAGDRDQYWDRAQKARGFFGAVDLLGDDRVKTYIRYGPARREQFNPQQFRSETLTVVVRPAEIWSYDKLGFQFDFVKTGTAYKLVGETRFGPGVVVPMLAQVDLARAAPPPREEALSFDLEFTLNRFEHGNDSVETEIHYGIAQEQMAGLVRGGALPQLYVRMEFASVTGKRVITRNLWVVPSIMPEPDDPRLAVGLESFCLPADVYTVTVRAWSADGSVEAERVRKLNLVDYVRRAQPASDVVFYSIADSTFQSPQFEGHGWRRLAPAVRPEVVSGRTLYVMYELYNLGLDRSGSHYADVDYEILEESTRRLVIIPTPRKVLTGRGVKVVVVERLHTMDLHTGNYILVVRARDNESDRDLALTGQFRIIPNPD